MRMIIRVTGRTGFGSEERMDSIAPVEARPFLRRVVSLKESSPLKAVRFG